MNSSRIIVALDYARPADALQFVSVLDARQCRLKVGKELFCRGGPSLVEDFVKQGFDVFLDLKFHDIPTTVAQACAAAVDMGVWMINVHAMGGRRMMEAAYQAVHKSANPPLLIAVTLLTSLSQEDIAEIGFNITIEQGTLRLAAQAHQSGLDGIVCSPREATTVRRTLGSAFVLVTPGVRPIGSNWNDQQRALTPQEAIRAGADFLVIGRPITTAANPQQALQAIRSEIDGISLDTAI